MKEKKDNILPKSTKNNFITSVDPVAETVMRQHYRALKDKQNRKEDLSKEEEGFIQEVESAYNQDRSEQEKQQSFLIQQAVEILRNEQHELYPILADIMSFDNKHRSFFDNIEQVITEVYRLNLTTQIPFRTKDENPQNLLNYISYIINTIIDNYRDSVVSSKVVNALLSQLTGAYIIVTDETGRIRFINPVAEKLLKMDNEDAVTNGYIGDFIKGFPKIKKELKKKHKLVDCEIEITVSPKNQAITKYLTMPDVVAVDTEVAEFVFILTDHPNSMSEVDSIKQENEPNIKLLEEIIAAANLLKKIHEDGNQEDKRLSEIIYNKGYIVLQNLQGDIRPLSFAYSINDYDKIHFKAMVDGVVELLSQKDKTIKFHSSVEVTGSFYSREDRLLEIIGNLILYRMGFKKPRIQMEVDIVVKNWKQQGRQITILDNGKLFSKKEISILGNPQLAKIDKTLKKLKGSMELSSNASKGTAINIYLPQ